MQTKVESQRIVLSFPPEKCGQQFKKGFMEAMILELNIESQEYVDLNVYRIYQAEETVWRNGFRFVQTKVGQGGFLKLCKLLKHIKQERDTIRYLLLERLPGSLVKSGLELYKQKYHLLHKSVERSKLAELRVQQRQLIHQKLFKDVESLRLSYQLDIIVVRKRKK